MSTFIMFGAGQQDSYVQRPLVCGEWKECRDCNGSGYAFGDGGQCDRCNGEGRYREEENFRFGSGGTKTLSQPLLRTRRRGDRHERKFINIKKTMQSRKYGT